MEELDLLKKDWNKDHYPKVSENEIYKLMLKKSSSTVKWIFIISLIELGFGAILGIGLSFTKFDQDNTKVIKEMGIYGYYQVVTVLMYAVVIYFIVRFYIMYRKVSTTDNTKQLMNNILKTRKTVQNYILFNLVTFALIFISFTTYVLNRQIGKMSFDTAGKTTPVPDSVFMISFLVILVFTIILTTIFWLIYKLIYGFLLKRLKNNFEELKKIDL